jgi:outer membrane protein
MRWLTHAIPYSLFLCATLGFARAESLTWEDCLREAADANPDLAAAWQAVQSADAGLGGSRSARWPQISASAAFDRSGGSRVRTEDDSTRDQYTAGVRATQPLYTGGRIPAEIGQSQAQLDESRGAFFQSAANVSFDLRTAFARLLYAQQLTTLTADIEKRREDNLRLVELRYEGGREHKGSYLRSKAAATQARFEASQAGRALHVAQRNLARALGRTESRDLAVHGAFMYEPPVGEPDYAALALRSPLRDQAEARRRFNEARVRLARSGYFPELSLSGLADRNDEDFFPDEDRWVAGVALEVPVFTGGRTRHEVAGARASLRQAEEQLRGREADVRRDLEAAHASWVDGVEGLHVQEESLEAAEVRAEIARRQYASGLLSFEDWDVIENELINAEKFMLSARRDAVVAEAAWNLAQGKGYFGEP